MIDQRRSKKISELIDREEIGQCVFRYSRGVDRHDTAMVTSVYHADALDDHGEYIGPGSGAGNYPNASHDGLWEAHQHFVLNSTIELAGDTAHVESYFISAGRRLGNTATDLHGGRYVDRFQKRNGQWAIAARVAMYEWGARAEDSVEPLKSFILGLQDASDVSFMRPLEVLREKRAP